MAEYMSDELKEEFRKSAPVHHYDPKHSSFQVRIVSDDGETVSCLSSRIPEPEVVKEGNSFVIATAITWKCARVLNPETDTVYFDDLKVWERGRDCSTDIIRHVE